MKKILLSFLIFGFFNCTVHRHYLNSNLPLSKLSQDELNILVALEFVQYDNKDCTGDCIVSVSGLFEYFDTCLEVFDSSYYYSIGLDYNDNNAYLLDGYYVNSFGRIVFEKKTDKNDYQFSPALIDEKTRHITVQVKNRNNENYIVGFNILKDDLYFSYTYEYPSDNCYW